MKIEQARKEQAADIALLIMTAMDHDCCRWFAAPDHGLDDFYRMMTGLVRDDCSQYSYRNTLVASVEGNIAGALISYDGGMLHNLRPAFVSAAKSQLGKDYSTIDDETGPGELYLDSLAVKSRYRGQGVATALLRAGIEKARNMNIPRVGLLVDKNNDYAERLYTKIGFRYANDASWGGHPMRHLIYDTNTETHPFEPFLPKDARMLMLGTFPPSRSRWCMPFYYPNYRNDMWRIMGLIYYRDKQYFVDEEHRTYRLDALKTFLREKGIAIYDTAYRVRRKKKTASDKDLDIVEPTDLDALLALLPRCVTVLTAGLLATQVVARHYGVSIPEISESREITVGNRVLRLCRMPSSSRAYPMSLERKARAYEEAICRAGHEQLGSR